MERWLRSRPKTGYWWSMSASIPPVPPSVACIDLRSSPEPISVEGAEVLAAEPAETTTLLERGVSMVVVFCDRNSSAAEGRLRAVLEPSGIRACWLRMDAVATEDRHSLAPGPQMVRLLTEALALATSLPTRADAGSPLAGEASRLAVERLSAREQQVLAEVARGASNKEVGHTLRVSPHTVGNHLRSIYRKLGVSGRHALLARLAQR